ncbi:DUF2062 domain-containing protein [Rhodovibrionaceae bacterium A322]
MLFKRRKPQEMSHRLAGYVWPRQGVRRTAQYMAHRLSRIPGRSYWIAAGFASGAAASFTPFVGLHFILAALLALAVRGNVLASAFGTIVGNPWTFPFIWTWIYFLGNVILGHEHAPHVIFEHLSYGHIVAAWNSDTFLHDFFWPLFWPMLVGGLPSAVVVWFVVFWPLDKIIQRYQMARSHRLATGKKAKVAQAFQHAPVSASSVQGSSAPPSASKSPRD